MSESDPTGLGLEPPWVLFVDQGRPISIMPAGRPGDVFSVVGWRMADAKAVVRAVNAIHSLAPAQLADEAIREMSARAPQRRNGKK